MHKHVLMCAVMVLLGLCGRAVADDVIMPQFGHQTITVSAGNPVTFLDMKEHRGINSSSSNNSFATTIFQPAEAGNSIRVTFHNLDVRNDGSNWPAYVKVYDGVFDVSSVTYPTSTSGVNATEFPVTGKQLDRLDGTYTNLVYISSDASGALSVCYHYKYAKAIDGWTATVESVTLDPMTVTGAAGDNSEVVSTVWAGKTNVAVAGMEITTDGYSSPDQLQSLTFTCSSSAVLDPATLKFYAGFEASTAALSELAGTITENAGVYTFTLTTPQALGHGLNTFCLGGDVLATAPFNATTTVNITGISTTAGYTAFTPDQAVTVTVQPMYLMAADAAFTIGEPTAFYDEGGPEGKVIKGFTGKVVFEPATEGRKVQLTFKDIQVFYTDYAANSSGYVDMIKVYNGNSTDDADLIWQLTEQQASLSTDLVLKSTAADGKLTVTHTCNVSYDGNLKDGWRAVVDEFTPQAMTLSELTYTKQSGNTVAGGADVLLGAFTLTTANTEPALAVASLQLTTNSTFAQMSKLKLYYTRDNTFATSTPVGEVAVSGDQITIPAAASVPFREGENHLWLTADINPMAVNGLRLEFVPVKLSFTNSTDYTSFAAIEGGLSIDNKAIQACGTQTFHIQGEWLYTHTVASEYSSKYLAENCEQTVIFKPIHEGNVIQIDYSDFDVYYASSSYSTRAKYVVYAGEGTSGDILWQLDANGKQPSLIRSTAASGALTIVFNPNTTSSYYTGNGWHAAVKEYALQDMAVESLSVEQAGTKPAKLGEAKAALLNVNIQTEGTLNPLMLNALTVNLKGCEANLTTVYLLQGSTVLAQADAAANVTLSLPTPAELVEYDNEFVIAADVKDNAAIDAAIDAALTTITLSGVQTAVEDGDPEEERVIKNMMNMAASDNGTVTIGQNSLMLYDDGGADEQYTAGFEGYVTFVPATEGYAVELVFKDFDVAYISGDAFHVYYANAYDAQATPDKSFGMYSKPADNQSLISAAADGSLTVHVKMPSSRMRGFEVEVRQHLLTDLVMDSVVVTSLAPAQATKGSSDLRLLQAAVYVSGDRKPLTITAFEQTASLQLTDRHIYATGHSANFATNNEFVDSYVISEQGVYYFWFVGGISTSAEVGDDVSCQLTNVVCGSTSVAPTQATPATVHVVSGAHGYYLIGAGRYADYATLTDALAAIQNIGMDGAVTLAVESGTYTEQVTIPQISGAGAANTLTICSASGDYNDVTYQFNGNTLSNTNGVLTIAGADYVTVKDISFTSTFTSNQTPTVVVVNNASTHVTIDHCRIYAAPCTEYTTRIDLLRVDAGDNLYNTDFALTNSVLEGGYMGMNVVGHKAAADPLQRNMLIRGNTFRNQGRQMLYGDAVSNLQIIGNTFRAQVQSSNAVAIDWLLMGDTATIAANDFLYTGTAADAQSIKCVYIRPNSYQDKQNTLLRVINNVINVQNESTYASYCINFSSNMCKLFVAHNTMVLNSQADASSPVYIEAAPTAGSLFVNNIFQAIDKGYTVRYKNASAIANIAYEHNIFYTPAATFGMPTANVSTYADWLTAVEATPEQGNMNEAVLFASANLLLPKQTNDGHLLTAAVLSDVTTDVTGKQRADTPTIGAYEFDPELLTMPTMAQGYPQVTNIRDITADIVVKADNMGTARVLVLPADEPAPDAPTVLANGVELVMQKNAEAVITIPDLSEETTYTAYVLLLSPIAEADNNVATTDPFTTAWTLRPVQLQPIAPLTIGQDAEFTLTATLVNMYPQAQPYTYKWYTAFGDQLAEQAVPDFTTTAQHSTEYICSVTDRFGQSALVSAHVHVIRPAEAATFEEYVLAPGEHKMVDDAWADNTETCLYSGTYAFANTPNKAYNAFNGFVISADASAEYTGNYMVDQFRSAAGGAYQGQNFAVAYYSAPSAWFAGYADPISLVNSAEPQTIAGCYITNSAYTLDAILNGDYANAAFAQGDYLELTVSGYDGNELTDEVVFYLADYRSDNPDEHFALDTWQWLDLSPLGAVTRVEFEMYTTKSDDYGFTTPTYFCIDNFGTTDHGPATNVHTPHANSLPCKRLDNGTLLIILPDGTRYDANGKRIN